MNQKDEMFNLDDLSEDEVSENIGSEYDNAVKVDIGKEYIEENLWEKIERIGKKISFAKDVKALYNYMTDSSVAWYRKSIVVGALVYFIMPIDSIPDLAPLIGYLDDLGVITAVLKYMGSELIPYYD
jgi:uncharacterized membrane protein YkvA (DUF1232 family)